MRHYEAQYRLNQFEMTQQLFFAAYKRFTDTFANIDGTPQMKSSLEKQVKAYADTFKDWIARDDHVRPLRAEIDIDSQRMLPHADEIIEPAPVRPRKRQRRASPYRRPARGSASSPSASPWPCSVSASAG